ncbi:MAG: hypothetical protein K0R48_1506 [Gammaproteobacteria bacterium]|nr:hypothetical protein [Gammaproteobacteria bacterium]
MGIACADTPKDTNTIMNPDIPSFNADNSDEGVKNTKPFNLSVNQDSLLGLIIDTNTLFKFNDTNAADIELAGGARVFRANGTYGYALNEKNRIKITGEYLTEALDFDYLSGDTRQWVQQGAMGAAYQYWLGGSTFKSLQIGGYYSQAASKQLSDKTVILDNGINLLDQRRIAGGRDMNTTAETAMSLWSHSLLTLGVDYDQVHYDTKYEIHNDSNAQGVGGHAELQQLLGPSTQLDLKSSVSPLFSNYGGSLNWIWTSKKRTAWAAGFNSTYTADYTTQRRFWVNGVNVNVVWDTPYEGTEVARYSDPDVAAQDLSTWSAKPVVRMPDVLAISDERIIQTNGSNPGNVSDDFMSIRAACPAQLQYDDDSQTYSAEGGWVQSYPHGAASHAMQPVFQSADLMSAQAGEVECEYLVGLQKTVLLTNPAYTYVEADGNNWQAGQDPYWPSTEGTPAETCGFGASNTQCTFVTADPHTTATARPQQSTKIS